uniref:Cytokine receptor common subunit beta N-terminal domain-containing protein n=1 Tax=Strigops habroptila TaxID=2489341 RepID=A0A672TLH1_STRHB
GDQRRSLLCLKCHYLHLQSLHLFCLNPFSESIPMKSLSCYNDYNSQVTCTWMERSEAHALVGMILYQRYNIIT